MAITFTLDDDGNVTWDRQRGAEVTQQEAMVMAAMEMARSLAFIGQTINGLTEAVESMGIDSAIDKIAERLEGKPKPKPKPKTKAKKRRR